MVDRGAKYLLLLSRSGASTAGAQALLRDLENCGVKYHTPKCDISNAVQLQHVLDSCRTILPPIRGCIQASLVLRDSTFDNMAYQDWVVPFPSKVSGSWNPHGLLPRNMAHFILLSSGVGILGNRVQASFAAANTYQDALAHNRLQKAESALSLDLPLLGETGSLSVTKEAADRLTAGAKIGTMMPEELHALLDRYSNPANPPASDAYAQPILGIITPVDLKAKGLLPTNTCTSRRGGQSGTFHRKLRHLVPSMRPTTSLHCSWLRVCKRRQAV